MQTIELKRTNSNEAGFRTLTTLLDADLRHRNGLLMDVYDQHNIIEENNTVVLAFVDGEPVGCGCFKKYDEASVEIKRMFVQPSFRGRGISLQILSELEKWAKELGYRYTVLETGSKQTEAIALYTKAGYNSIANYGPYADMPNSLCFKKTL